MRDVAWATFALRAGLALGVLAILGLGLLLLLFLALPR